MDGDLERMFRADAKKNRVILMLLVKIRELRKQASDMFFVISSLEAANDEAVVRDGVMLDTEHFAKALRELGVEV